MGGRKKQDKSIFKISQFQPNDCVTSSAVMVEVGGKKILLDLGQLQDSKLEFNQIYDRNLQKIRQIPFGELDCVVLSHFHLDHSGFIPLLARDDLGFKGRVVSTEITVALSELIMRDAWKINVSEVAKNNLNPTNKKGKKYYEYYSEQHVDDIVSTIECYSYFTKVRLSDDITVTLLPACHASGASMTYIEYSTEHRVHTLLYTGDITYGHEVDRPFTKMIQDMCLKADVVICESTYGRRDKKTYEHKHPVDFLEEVIMEQVVKKNKTLWIPSFAVHRATSIYLALSIIYERNPEIRKLGIPAYFCGQMMMDAHRIILKKQYEEYYDTQWVSQKPLLLKEPFGFCVSKKDVERFCLNNSRKIIVSSSGMFDKGYSSMLADSYVSNGNVACVACGYQGEGTLGYEISQGSSHATVNGQKRKVKCLYQGVIPEMSGHASHDGLVSFIKSLNQTVLKNIILVHGDDEAKFELKEDLEKALSKNKTIHIIKQFETIKC